jgi:lactate dehydrogenase-like 2-hydroxyacid dehydrogenase
MQNRIYVTREIPEIGIKILKEKGYEVIVGEEKKPLSQKDIIKILQKAEKKGKPYNILLTLLTDKIDKTVFNIAPSLKMVSNYAIGYDNVDVKEACKRGIMVTNTPGDYMGSIAEHVVSMTLSLCNRIAEADHFVRKGRYKGWDPMLMIGHDVSEKTIGIIGAGRIGEKVSYTFNKGFGCRIVYFDQHKNENIERDCGAIKAETMDDLIKQSDIISLHVPLNDQTHHMVNEDFISKMKPDSFIINTSRGPVVDEKYLYQALKENKIAGAGLDVFEFEPKVVKGLTKLGNVILTPHIASASIRARDIMARVAAQNIIDFIEGRKVVNDCTR